MNVKTSKAHPRFSFFFPVWLRFHAAVSLCSEWGLWGGLCCREWELVWNSRGMSRGLWLLCLCQHQLLGLGFYFSFFNTFLGFLGVNTAFVHPSPELVCMVPFYSDGWVKSELSSASAHMCWKLCGRLLPICFAIPGYSSNLCTVCFPRCAEPDTFQEEASKWKTVFQHLEQSWLLAILYT